MTEFRDLSPEDRAYSSRQHLYVFLDLAGGAVGLWTLNWLVFHGCPLLMPWGCYL
jgi:hypothetical protein